MARCQLVLGISIAMAASSETTVEVKTLVDMEQYRKAAQVPVGYVPTELQEGRRVGVAGRGALSGINCFWVPASVTELKLYVGGKEVARYEHSEERTARGERKELDGVVYLAWRPFAPFFPLEALLLHKVEFEASEDCSVLCEGFYYAGGKFTANPEVRFGELMIPMVDGAYGRGEQRENVFQVVGGCGGIRYES